METSSRNTPVSREEIGKQYAYMDAARQLLAGAPHYALVRTYGCQQNEADSERLSGMLVAMGYTLTEEEERADLILVNTCAVREHAELKALSITGQFKHLKERKPSLIIGICGCMVTQEHRGKTIKHSYPYVDLLFGTSMLHRFPELLYAALKTGKRQLFPGDGLGKIAEGLPVKRESDFKAWVSIMYGCNNFCSYCVVPYVRGRERSREPEEILREVRELAAAGYREITLLGQNVNSYGKDLATPTDFPTLLEEICRVEGDFLIRFMTSHPKDATRRLVDVMAANPKIARHFHLPLQSGSDEILRRMNRHYTAESYLSFVRYLREKIPEISLTTDIIVGFPGETEEDFERTLAMLRTVEYDNLYSFIFSKRKGTPAAEMENQVPPEVQKERFARLLAVQTEISKRKNLEYVGKTIPVLVEGRSKTDDSKLTGRNEKGRLVHFEGEDALIGKEVRVTVERADTYALFGRLSADEQTKGSMEKEKAKS